ncbi:hypothetical protein [Lactiplantibacillus plantarum]|uniref:hypothetical protein n=1 Tax=Lactiplantibacillus plantarum TaxID=1590 RepID=UPI003FA465E8
MNQEIENIDKYVATHFAKMTKSIYGWSVKDGKCVPPKIIFPKPVVERIEYFAAEMENGLTFQGALEFIFAGDEKSVKKNVNNSWIGCQLVTASGNG